MSIIYKFVSCSLKFNHDEFLSTRIYSYKFYIEYLCFSSCEGSSLNSLYLLQYPNGIRPQMFKTLIGQGHPEFSTKRQQDAQEFLLHLLNQVEVRPRS